MGFIEYPAPLNAEKSESLIQKNIGELTEKGKAKVKMYTSHDTRQGITYKEDKSGVMTALKGFKEDELCPERLRGRIT